MFALHRVIAGFAILLAVALAPAFDRAPGQRPAESGNPTPSAETRTITLRLTDDEGRAIPVPGECRTRPVMPERGVRTLAAPADAASVTFERASDPIALRLPDGPHGVWIDVPGFARFATVVFVDRDRTLPIRLHAAGSITVQVDEELPEGAWIVSRLSLRPARRIDQDFTGATFEESPRAPTGWSRLPPGAYVLEVDCLLPPFGTDRRSEKRSITRQLTLRPGEDLVARFGDGEFAPKTTPLVEGRLLVPRAWWDGETSALGLVVTLFDKEARQSGSIQTALRGWVQSTPENMATLRWSSRMLRPGRYVVRVDPLNFWTDIVVVESQPIPDIVVGEPAELRVRLSAPGDDGVDVPGWLHIAPCAIDTNGWADVGRGEPWGADHPRARVARGQRLRFSGGVTPRYLIDSLDVDVGEPVCSVELPVVPSRLVNLRLVEDDRPVPSSASWGMSAVSVSYAQSSDRAPWVSEQMPDGALRFRVPSSVPIRFELALEGARATPVLLAPTNAVDTVEECELRVIRD